MRLSRSGTTTSRWKRVRTANRSSAIIAILRLRLDLHEVHADQPRTAGFFHGHTVEDVGCFHRPARVRDHDELRVVRHVAHRAYESIVIDLVERRVDLVEDAERARLVAEDGKEERQRRERALPAGEQGDRLVFLSRRLRDQLDAALEDVFLIEELHSRCAAAEERGENLTKELIGCRKRVAEPLPRGDVDLPDRAAQRLDRLHQIVALRAQERLALLQLLMLFDGQDVDRSDALEMYRQAE